VQVRLLRRERNLGFVRNFGETLREAKGELIFLCDQDDLWHPDKLATMSAQFARDASLLLLFSDARLVEADGRPLPHSLFEASELTVEERQALRGGQAFRALLRRSMVTGATAGFRRRLLDVGLPIGDGWLHDEWLALIAAATGRVDVIERELIDYRQHGGNQIGMRMRTWRDRWADLLRPRSGQFADELCRLQALHRHLSSIDAGDFGEPLREIVLKHDHFQRRVAFGARPRWARLTGVFREAARGDYRRYGTGGRSMLRDLLRRG
jgi:glycosyltransferase involved in cell wall biosynthesis